MYTQYRADVKCTYMCTDLEVDQCNCQSTGEMMGISSQFHIGRVSAFLSTEAVTNKTKNDHRMYWIVYQLASEETVSKCYLERRLSQLPRDDHSRFRSNQDHGRRTPKSDRKQKLSGVLHCKQQLGCVQMADRNECRTTILEVCKPAWLIVREDEYNN